MKKGEEEPFRRGLKVSDETWNLIEDAKNEFRHRLKKKPTVDQLLNTLLRNHLRLAKPHQVPDQGKRGA